MISEDQINQMAKIAKLQRFDQKLDENNDWVLEYPEEAAQADEFEIGYKAGLRKAALLFNRAFQQKEPQAAST